MSRQIRLGIHASNPSLLALSKTEFLQHRVNAGVAIEWVRLPAGPKSIDYIGANLIDISGTGATPPIAGQASGVPLAYIATSRPRPVGGIAVRADSAIRSLADLRGKTIALGLGSWLQQLLVTALNRVGLEWIDIVPLDLQDGPAQSALAAGDIDAWVTGNSLIEEGGLFRLIARTGDLVSNPSVFFARRDFAERNLDLVEAVVRALDDVDHWISGNPGEAAAVLSAAAGNGTPLAQLRSDIQHRPWGLIPVGNPFLAEQQAAADLFYRFGLLPRAIDVREATLAAPIVIERAA
jgi:sulfonate transport system substrate-binding protein